MADLKEKVALVTGASRGVGRGIAEGLAETGATVYLTARTMGAADGPTPGTLMATAAAVEALGGRPLPLAVDHSDDQAVLELFRRIESESGRLDLLVNNAFQVPDPPAWSGAFWEHPLDVWDDQCGVGLRGCYVASAMASRLMVEQGGGLIVNLSGGIDDGYRFSTAYGVCKAGVDRMAADMAHELAGHGVTALSLAPGPVRTELVEAALARGEMDLDPQALRSPRFVGRCIAALAMDPDVADKTGGRFEIEALRREYRFSELQEGAG
jgi:NAD(P)-dependent dehydrogenase (short-subunit alcohol dehydrogenase family)